jgi:thiol-disulfide isomerase/thioredoxin
MIKKLVFILVLTIAVNAVFCQKIYKWKINDVVNFYSAKNDTAYIVNFWATFCKPCNEEIPHFIQLVEKYKSKKVKLLLVSVDLASYVQKKLPAFIKANHYNTNHAWLNETNADYFCPKIDSSWSGAIPSTIFVNNLKGYKKFFEGEMTAKDFEQFLQEATQ